MKAGDGSHGHIAHELRDQGLTWGQIGNQLGISKDAARSACRVYEGTHHKPKSASVVDDHAAGGADEKPQPTYDERIEQAKEVARAKIDEQTYKRLLAERGRTELMMERLETAVRALPTVVPKPFVIVKSKHADEHAVLCISDVHIGEFVDPEQTGGLGAYNMAIFQQRMDNLKQSVAEIIDIQRKSYNIPKLHVFFIGDIVTGEGIYRGQSNHIELDVTEQVFEGVQQFGLMIAEFRHVFSEIHCTGVYGNHGRVGIKGENRLYTNWDRVAYKFMYEQTKNQTNLTWNIPKAWFAREDVLGSLFHLSHGEQLKSQLGTPYYALNRYDAQQTQLHRDNPHRYLIVGHHHQAAEIDSPHGERLMNSTWVGGSLFSLYALSASTEPSQWFFGVSPKRGISWRYKLMLEDGDTEQVSA